MRTALIVIWWIGLLGALLPTLVILKQASLIVGVLGDIQSLAERTRRAARGIAANVEAVDALSTVEGAIAPLPPMISSLTAALDRLASRLHALGVR